MPKYDWAEDHDDYVRRVQEFSAALSRLLVLAKLIVSATDDPRDLQRVYPRLYRPGEDAPIADPLIRHAFVEADRAWSRAKEWPWLGWPVVPMRYRGAQAATETYANAMGTAWVRWGCYLTWQEDERGAWTGGAYPPDFPGPNHLIRPRELELLGVALSLASIPPVDDDASRERRPIAAFGSVKLYGSENEPEVRGKKKPPLTYAQYHAVRALVDSCLLRANSSKPRPSLTDLQRWYEEHKITNLTDIATRLVS